MDNKSLDNNSEIEDDKKHCNTDTSNINIVCTKKSTNYSKMKICQLHDICNEKGIDIYKTSEKTGKKIKKTKADIVNELNV